MATPPPDARPLSAEARRVLALVAAHAARAPEVLAGLEAEVETTTVQHGRFGPDAGGDTSGEVSGDGPAGTNEFASFLDGPGVERLERPAERPGEIRVWTRSEAPEGDMLAEVEFVFAGERLVRASMEAQMPGIARLAMATPPTGDLTFDTVDGVPLVTEARMRMRSRGVGRFRLDMETVTTVRYTPRA